MHWPHITWPLTTIDSQSENLPGPCWKRPWRRSHRHFCVDGSLDVAFGTDFSVMRYKCDGLDGPSSHPQESPWIAHIVTSLCAPLSRFRPMVSSTPLWHPLPTYLPVSTVWQPWCAAAALCRLVYSSNLHLGHDAFIGLNTLWRWCRICIALQVRVTYYQADRSAEERGWFSYLQPWILFWRALTRWSVSKPSHKWIYPHPDFPFEEAQESTTVTVLFFGLQLLFLFITAYIHALTTKTLQQTNFKHGAGGKMSLERLPEWCVCEEYILQYA